MWRLAKLWMFRVKTNICFCRLKDLILSQNQCTESPLKNFIQNSCRNFLHRVPTQKPYRHNIIICTFLPKFGKLIWLLFSSMAIPSTNVENSDFSQACLVGWVEEREGYGVRGPGFESRRRQRDFGGWVEGGRRLKEEVVKMKDEKFFTLINSKNYFLSFWRHGFYALKFIDLVHVQKFTIDPFNILLAFWNVSLTKICTSPSKIYHLKSCILYFLCVETQMRLFW